MNVGGSYEDFVNVYALCRVNNFNALADTIQKGMKKGKYEDSNTSYFCYFKNEEVIQLSKLSDIYYQNNGKGLNAFFFRFERKLAKESENDARE